VSTEVRALRVEDHDLSAAVAEGDQFVAQEGEGRDLAGHDFARA
jgi:hypothetical protein